jgi:hypothetical protein
MRLDGIEAENVRMHGENDKLRAENERQANVLDTCAQEYAEEQIRLESIISDMSNEARELRAEVEAQRAGKMQLSELPAGCTPVPGQYKEAIFMIQGHHFQGPLVCASCKRSLDSSYCGGTWQVDRCVCEGKP